MNKIKKYNLTSVHNLIYATDFCDILNTKLFESILSQGKINMPNYF